MTTVFSAAVQLLAMALPPLLKRVALRFLLGWQIGPGTTIGLSLILCRHVWLGAYCRIGHFNLIRDLKLFVLGNQAVIMNLNHFMARVDDTWPAECRIGNSTLITSRHFFDCGGLIRIGEFCCVGGRDSQFWTHSLGLRADGLRALEWRELDIAPRCYIGARVTFVHCRIPSDSVVGAGAVVTRDCTAEGPGLLLAGNPARVKKRYHRSLIVAKP